MKGKAGGWLNDMFSIADKMQKRCDRHCRKESQTDVLMLHLYLDCGGYWHVSDDSYDGAPDAGEQRVGHDKKLSVALGEYIRHELGTDDEAYLIHKSEFYNEWE